MAKKRERLEIMNDIMAAIRDSNNSIGPTRLLSASNLSPQMFKEYIEEMLQKKFIELKELKGKKTYSLKKKGFEFIQRYHSIIDFIDNFGLK